MERLRAAFYEEPRAERARERERGAYDRDDAEADDERLFDGSLDRGPRVVAQPLRRADGREPLLLRGEFGAGLFGKTYWPQARVKFSREDPRDYHAEHGNRDQTRGARHGVVYPRRDARVSLFDCAHDGRRQRRDARRHDQAHQHHGREEARPVTPRARARPREQRQTGGRDDWPQD